MRFIVKRAKAIHNWMHRSQGPGTKEDQANYVYHKSFSVSKFDGNKTLINPVDIGN